jgi:hypothetical protein
MEEAEESEALLNSGMRSAGVVCGAARRAWLWLTDRLEYQNSLVVLTLENTRGVMSRAIAINAAKMASVNVLYAQETQRHASSLLLIKSIAQQHLRAVQLEAMQRGRSCTEDEAAAAVEAKLLPHEIVLLHDTQQMADKCVLLRKRLTMLSTLNSEMRSLLLECEQGLANADMSSHCNDLSHVLKRIEKDVMSTMASNCSSSALEFVEDVRGMKSELSMNNAELGSLPPAPKTTAIVRSVLRADTLLSTRATVGPRTQQLLSS